MTADRTITELTVYKYRIYPDRKQEELFAKTFGCVRFVYNQLLSEKKEAYEKEGKSLRNTPAHLKAAYEWLREVDSLALANAQLQLEAAYKKFFSEKNVGFPKFKSRKSPKHSYTTNCVNGNIRIVFSGESRKNGVLHLPKAGDVSVKLHRKMKDGSRIKSVTVSREGDGRYYASVLVETVPASEILPQRRPVETKAIGLDYSSPDFYVDSGGRRAEMPHFYRDTEKKLCREQRKLSKMKKDSSNYRKQKKKIAGVHRKLRNQRKDWQHKESCMLTDEYDVICVEDIDYKQMARGLHLAKATNDNGFGQFRGFLAYKAKQKEKKLVTIDKWFASSKLCSCCGEKHEELKLADRKWICMKCGAHHDRDVNAAVNIRNEGLRMLG